ncbi:MAG: tyrosine-protein phosphatase [Aristaeellaceae bacterium]
MSKLSNMKRRVLALLCAWAIMTTGCFAWGHTASAEAADHLTEEKDTMEQHMIDIGGIDNARQLGGYIGADGRRVKDGLLLRTGRLDTLSAEAAAELAEQYHIQYVVDFRMGYEREKDPDQEIPGAQNVWINLYEVDMSNPDMVALMRRIAAAQSDLEKSVEYAKSGRLSGLYTELLMRELGQQGYAQFFDILLEADGAVLWHCTHGKDRTGVAAALLLYVLGVDEEVIMQDFLLTNEVYQDAILQTQAALRASGYDDALVQEAQAMVGVKGEYLEAALEAVRQTYGSLDAYIRDQLGVSEEEQQLLREKYLESVPTL